MCIYVIFYTGSLRLYVWAPTEIQLFSDMILTYEDLMQRPAIFIDSDDRQALYVHGRIVAQAPSLSPSSFPFLELLETHGIKPSQMQKVLYSDIKTNEDILTDTDQFPYRLVDLFGPDQRPTTLSMPMVEGAWAELVDELSGNFDLKTINFMNPEVKTLVIMKFYNYLSDVLQN